MNPVVAMMLIARLKKMDGKYIPLTHNDAKKTGLKVHHVTKNPDTDKPLFCFIDRLEYIKHLESSNNLIKKRQAILDVLRSSLRK